MERDRERGRIRSRDGGERQKRGRDNGDRGERDDEREERRRSPSGGRDGRRDSGRSRESRRRDDRYNRGRSDGRGRRESSSRQQSYGRGEGQRSQYEDNGTEYKRRRFSENPYGQEGQSQRPSSSASSASSTSQYGNQPFRDSGSGNVADQIRDRSRSFSRQSSYEGPTPSQSPSAQDQAQSQRMEPSSSQNEPSTSQSGYQRQVATQCTSGANDIPLGPRSDRRATIERESEGGQEVSRFGSQRGRGRGFGRGGGHGEGRAAMRSGSRGRARGRGGSRGGRGDRRGVGRVQEIYDVVVSRPRDDQGQFLTKRAALRGSQSIQLYSNFFQTICRRCKNIQILHYRVDFSPEQNDIRIQKKLLNAHISTLPGYVFDGSSLYTMTPIPPQQLLLHSQRETDNQTISLSLRQVGTLNYTDVTYLQLLNIIVRKCMESLSLSQMGRHFYDHTQAIRIDAHQLELWPGFKTSMRNHENGILFNVEITHKVLRIDTCLHMIRKLDSTHKTRSQIKDKLVNSIVMTTYNRKTYRIDDIDWNKSPLDTFEKQGVHISFVDYFRTTYNVLIRDVTQPLLISRPKKRDYHRGQTGPIILIPELCQMTGMSDDMRENYQLMRAVAVHLHTEPVRRVERIEDFMRRMATNPSVQTELDRWGIAFGNRLVNFEGHTIPKEKILFRNKKEVEPKDYDWGMAFRDSQLFSCVPLKHWAIIVPSRDSMGLDNLIQTMQRCANPMGFNLALPLETRTIRDIRPNDYSKAVDEVMNSHGGQIQMVFVILPKQSIDTYAAVKKRACIQYGVPSQCFVAKNANNPNRLMSICTKLVVQMSAKIGGEPWTVKVPLKNLMIVGYDVYHCGKRRGNSVGAMVATTSDTLAKYFSCVSIPTTRDDLSETLGQDFTKCLMAYLKVNNKLPDRIILYRDGVGDGQLQYVYETELNAMKKILEDLYKRQGRDPPKFSFIVVTKKINTRIFSKDGNRYVNPPPGTVVDDVVTLPERYDFFLVSQHSRQGTVSPVSYNVLYDKQELDADKIQKLTYKLCHIYFNWSGTVTVPAPCQYAKKLAYLTGTALQGSSSHEKLSNSLYYL